MGAEEILNKVMLVIFILIELLATTVFRSHLVMINSEARDVVFTIHTGVVFSNPSNGAVTWNFTEEDRTISLFVNNTWQVVHLTNCSCPLETVKTDEDGNRVAILLFPKSELKPGENMSYTVTYHAISKPRSIPDITEEASESLHEIPKDLSEKYCMEAGPWLTNDPQLRKLAYDIAKNETKVLTIIKKLIEWVNDNIAYAVHEIPYYPNETYIEGRGDCDDKAVLFATLCRILGIPAYIQIGCIYLPTVTNISETYWQGHVTSVQKRIGWHGWAMVYAPPWGWLPVDLTYVTDELDNPLNAIKEGAVTLQETVQYLSITKTDYVASSCGSREFFIKNDFYVYMEDEMILEIPKEPSQDEVYGWNSCAQVIIITAAVGATITGALMIFYIRKAKKAKLGAEPHNPHECA